MRRDYFTLEMRGLTWVEEGSDPEKPTVIIDFEGPASLLEERLGDEPAEDSEIDVTFRFQTELEESEATGVVSVTDRLTGSYVLELNAPAADVFEFIRAAREYGDRAGEDDDQYGFEIRIDGEVVLTYDKRTFLVYTRAGNLLREHSLIPSGVEL